MGEGGRGRGWWCGLGESICIRSSGYYHYSLYIFTHSTLLPSLSFSRILFSYAADIETR